MSAPLLEDLFTQIDAESFESWAFHPEAVRNTRVGYLYRDGSNYKQNVVVVFAGALTPDQAVSVCAALDHQGQFLPAMVGMESAEWSDEAGGDDHPYHELTEIALTTDPATETRTASDWAEAFIEIGPEGWIVPEPVVTLVETAAAAQAKGFATFNEGPHLLVNLPDGNFTLTTRDSLGRRVTISFANYGEGAPQFADIVYHDAGGETINNGSTDLPTFDIMGLNPKGTPFDTRRPFPEGHPRAGQQPARPTVAVLLMETKKK